MMIPATRRMSLSFRETMREHERARMREQYVLICNKNN